MQQDESPFSQLLRCFLEFVSFCFFWSCCLSLRSTVNLLLSCLPIVCFSFSFTCLPSFSFFAHFFGTKGIETPFYHSFTLSNDLKRFRVAFLVV